jgi:predicted nucleic acid-binding protein
MWALRARSRPTAGELGHLLGGLLSGSMTRYAIDAPTLVHLVEEGLAIHPSHQLVAPNSIRTEALELLLRDVRDRRRSDQEAMACHEKMTQLKMRLLGDRVSRRTAWQIARERDWASLRDAEYLAIAMLQADAFATVDPAMVRKAEDLVRVASVGQLESAG